MGLGAVIDDDEGGPGQSGSACFWMKIEVNMARSVTLLTTLLCDVPIIGEVEFDATVSADVGPAEPDVGIMSPQLEVTKFTVELPNGDERDVDFGGLRGWDKDRIEQEISDHLRDQEQEP